MNSEKVKSKPQRLTPLGLGARDGTCYAAAAATRPRRRKQSAGLFSSANCVCSLLFKSRPDYTAKQKEPLLRLFLFWCERRDLNPYGITTRPSNVRVCRFRHSRIQLLFPCGTFNIISDKVVFVNRFFQLFYNRFVEFIPSGLSPFRPCFIPPIL